MPKICPVIYAESIVNGANKTQAYLNAGGEAKHPAQAANQFHRKPEVKKLIQDLLVERTLGGLVGIPALSEKAVGKLFELMASDDEKVALQASKIALDKAKEFLPKEVNVTHSHQVSKDEQTNEALENIAKLIQQKATDGNGAAGKLLEAVRVGESGSDGDSDGEPTGHDGSSEYIIRSE